MDKSRENATLRAPLSDVFARRPDGVGRMSWRLLVVWLILAMPGCHSPGGAGTPTDPFFGRTRVDPPRTGATGGTLPAGGQLQGPANGAGGISGAATGQPAAALPPVTSWPAPPGGSQAATQPTQSSQPAWAPPQTRPNPVPAAIPSQSGAGYQPPDGSFGFPNRAGATAMNSAPAGSGDRLMIPSSARTLTERVQGAISQTQVSSSVAATSTGSQPGRATTGGSFIPPSSAASFPTASQGGANGYDRTPAANPSSPSMLRGVEPGTSTRAGSQPYTSSPSPVSPTPPSAPPADKPVNFSDLRDARS
jgi:hypothetical protein